MGPCNHDGAASHHDTQALILRSAEGASPQDEGFVRTSVFVSAGPQLRTGEISAANSFASTAMSCRSGRYQSVE